MGDRVGVFDDKEVEDLSEPEKEQLRDEIIRQLATKLSEEPEMLKALFEAGRSEPALKDALRKAVSTAFPHKSKLKLND
jgi:hypothetical protein